MRLTRSLAIAASTLALATGAAFAGEEPLTHQSDPMGYQPYEVYEVYMVPAEIVLIPLEQPSDAPISGNELG
jgi:hypothetical protein